MMKRIYGVVDTDNFGGDYPDEKFVVQCWLREETAVEITRLLNAENSINGDGDAASRYYKVVARGYKLQPGFEP
jgi:hypothetical protein